MSSGRRWWRRFNPNTLLAARMLNFANYAAHADEPEGAREFITARCEESEKLLAL